MKAIIWWLKLSLFTAVFISCNEENTEEHVIERGTVVDSQGHVYATVKIGDQWWMAENLAVNTFNDGTSISEILPDAPDSVWANVTGPAYTFVNDTLYGLLYNHAVIQDPRGIAPAGWHVPTDEDWKKLEETIGVSNVNSLGWRGETEAEDLVPKFSIGWLEGSYLFGTGKYGFEALPGGCILFNGERSSQGNTAFWWTSSSNQDEAYYRYIDANKKQIFRQKTYTNYGMSIRCVKN